MKVVMVIERYLPIPLRFWRRSWTLRTIKLNP